MQKVKLRNSELVNLNGAMAAVVRSGEKISPKLSYAIKRNQDLIKPITSALQEANKPIPEYIDYENERVELCKKMSKKDANGKPVIIKGPPMMPGQPPMEDYDIEDQAKFEEAMEVLKVKHKETMEQVTARQKEYADLLGAEIEHEFFYTSLNHFPKEISGPMNALMVFAIPPEGECPNCGHPIMEVIEGGADKPKKG